MTAIHISNTIRSRRSIYPKNYGDEKVSKDIIWEMLENANWAPTHKLTEPWRFVVFEGDGLSILADFQSGLYKKIAMKNNAYDPIKYEKLRTKPLLCSHIIAIGMRRDPNRSVPEIEEVAAVASAVQNMQLTASAHGVGCYWSTGGPTYYDEAKPFFGLEEGDNLLGFLNIGIPAKAPPPGRRRPVSEKVKWVSGESDGAGGS